MEYVCGMTPNGSESRTRTLSVYTEFLSTGSFERRTNAISHYSMESEKGLDGLGK